MHDFVELILSLLKKGGILAIAAALLCVVGVLIVYIIFRRVTKGEKKFPWRKTILLIMMIGYAVILFYATILRQSGLYGAVSLHLFRGWREAWNGFSTQLWLNVLLNVALFVPLGVLLPLIAKVFHRWYLTLAAGLGTTLFVEIVQYITARGLFDIDDIFNNVLGCMIGYELVMLYLTLTYKQEKKLYKSIAYASLPVIFSLSVIGIFVGYHLQEYGNIRDAAAFTANTSGITWELACSLESAESVVPVYKTESMTKKSCDTFGTEFANRMGVTFPDVYYYDGMTMFANHSTGDFLNVYYNDSSYEYSVGGVPHALESAETDEETLRTLLAPYGLTIPSNAKFKYIGNGKHTFTASMELVDNTIVDGTLTCWVREGNVLHRFQNNMLIFTYYKNEEIRTPEEAYEQLRRGNFSGGANFEYCAPDTLTVLSCTLEYRTDTKGFYRPVYVFKLTDYETYDAFVIVHAMK